jgi:hypothetical protein
LTRTSHPTHSVTRLLTILKGSGKSPLNLTLSMARRMLAMETRPFLTPAPRMNSSLHLTSVASLKHSDRLCLVDDDVVSTIYGAIEGATYDSQQGGWKFPSNATVPDVAFAVGDQLYTVFVLFVGCQLLLMFMTPDRLTPRTLLMVKRTPAIFLVAFRAVVISHSISLVTYSSSPSMLCT